LKNLLTGVLYACLFVGGVFLFAAFGFWWWLMPHYYLPGEQVVHQQFESHKAEFVRFVSLLREDHSARFVSDDGKVDIDGLHGRPVPEYRALMRD
jgi:hypothetical protein